MSPFGALQEKKTLLIDDDELVRDSLSIVFATNGCSLRTEESAEAGLRALKEENFDIIISDLRLPGADGINFLKSAALTQPQSVKFLITAYKDDQVYSEALRIGVSEFIDKPFSVDALVDLLALTLKNHAAQSELGINTN